MNNKKSKALGKGLAAILPDKPVFADFNTDVDKNESVQMIAIEKIIANPHQPRKEFDINKITELSEKSKNVSASLCTVNILSSIISSLIIEFSLLFFILVLSSFLLLHPVKITNIKPIIKIFFINKFLSY